MGDAVNQATFDNFIGLMDLRSAEIKSQEEAKIKNRLVDLEAKKTRIDAKRITDNMKTQADEFYKASQAKSDLELKVARNIKNPNLGKQVIAYIDELYLKLNESFRKLAKTNE